VAQVGLAFGVPQKEKDRQTVGRQVAAIAICLSVSVKLDR
jgi:hypothetical protein